MSSLGIAVFISVHYYPVLLLFQRKGRFALPTSSESGVDVWLLSHVSRSDLCHFWGSIMAPQNLFLSSPTIATVHVHVDMK